jgi:outer membrane protein OmpA-like peptidoglycan-associated protein
MTRPVFRLAALALALPGAAAAQSTVTLDSFSLDALAGDAPAPAQPPARAEAEMRDCLLDSAGCASAEFGNAADFTLDDVYNLGVIDRDAQPQRSAAAPDPTPLPSIDLEVLFAYDSDSLTPQAMAKLSSLAAALSDPRLADSRLLFIGHTDAVGSAAYNTALSQRRAQAVADYVRATLPLAGDRIEAVGLGFSRLKNRQDPSAAQNRRVQLVLVPGA